MLEVCTYRKPLLAPHQICRQLVRFSLNYKSKIMVVTTFEFFTGIMAGVHIVINDVEMVRDV